MSSGKRDSLNLARDLLDDDSSLLGDDLWDLIELHMLPFHVVLYFTRVQSICS